MVPLPAKTAQSCPLSHELEENFSRIPHEWDTALADGTLAQLGSYLDSHSCMPDDISQLPCGPFGVSVHHTEDWKYFIAVCSSNTDNPFEEYTIPDMIMQKYRISKSILKRTLMMPYMNTGCR